jgi:hypothetical protein
MCLDCLVIIIHQNYVSAERRLKGEKTTTTTYTIQLLICLRQETNHIREKIRGRH